MKTPFSSEIDYALKLGGFLVKAGTLLGGVCVVVYSLRIGRLPQGLTLGDGILFLMAAPCFAIIYLFFVASLVSLGIFVSPGIDSTLSMLLKYRSGRHGLVEEFRRSLLPFSWASSIPALFGGLFIFAMSLRDPAARWTLPVLALALYFFYSLACVAQAKLAANVRQAEGAIEVQGHPDALTPDRMSHFKSMRIVCTLMVALSPIFLGGVSGQLLDGAMRLAHLRVESATIHVKTPYSSLMPLKLQRHDIVSPTGYISFAPVVLLWTGVGAVTVVQFSDGSKIRVLDIPNDSVIIERS